MKPKNFKNNQASKIRNPIKIKQFLKKRLFSNNANLFGYEEKKKYLIDIIVKSIELGESNSILLIGPPGCGKTTLTRAVLDEISKTPELSKNFLKVELSGLIHTDDKLALKSISAQLCIQTLNFDSSMHGSYANNLAFLLNSLRMGNVESKCLLFILDKFELFCQHKTQMLLYNLYDIAQSAKTPLFIFGITCRLDALDMLEKRVKSRFSHRKLYLFNEMKFEDFVEYAKSQLILQGSLFNEDHHIWNSHVECLMNNTIVINVIRKIYDWNKDLFVLKQLLSLVISKLGPSNTLLQPEDFSTVHPLLFVDTKMTMLNGLSLLQLGLVIAMMKLTEKYKSFNFEMAYQEYSKYTSKHPVLQRFDKAVVYKAYEHLQAMELIKITERSAQLPRHLLVRLQLDSDQILRALAHYPNLPTVLQQWASSSLEE